MMGFINELEIPKADMDSQSQIDMILRSLPESFNQYVLNYNMNNLKLSLTELMKSLQGAEVLIKSKKSNSFIAENKDSSNLKPKSNN